MRELIQPEYKQRLGAAWDRIKAMDKADKKADFSPPISGQSLINVAFAALDSGNKEAMDEAIGYAFNAGIAYTAIILNKPENATQTAGTN